MDGGAFNYGAHAAARMGLKTAAVTRLAAGDSAFLDELRRLGVDVYVTYTPQSTSLTLEYPSLNPDERVLYVSSSAGPFTCAKWRTYLAKRSWLASLRGEVPREVLEAVRRELGC